MLKSQDFFVRSLGECQHDSPLNLKSASHKQATYFASDSQRIRLDVALNPAAKEDGPRSFELAGPRQRIFFRPDETTAAIVTCGGLSPGLNNVIRSVFYEIFENYGVNRVLGIRNAISVCWFSDFALQSLAPSRCSTPSYVIFATHREKVWRAQCQPNQLTRPVPKDGTMATAHSVTWRDGTKFEVALSSIPLPCRPLTELHGMLRL